MIRYLHLLFVETMESPASYCFASLAMGKIYVEFALRLAEDLALHARQVPFFVLTDCPERFDRSPNVVAVRHKLRSVRGFNDKLCVVVQALVRYPTCVFLDADCRVMAPVSVPSPSAGLRARYINTWRSTERRRGRRARRGVGPRCVLWPVFVEATV